MLCLVIGTVGYYLRSQRMLPRLWRSGREKTPTTEMMDYMLLKDRGIESKVYDDTPAKRYGWIERPNPDA